MPATRHQLYLRLHDRLKPAKRVLVVTHEHADGDALGSLLALGAFLGADGKRVQLYAPDSTLSSFSYLEGITSVIVSRGNVRVEDRDFVVMLDCGDVKRTNVAEPLFMLNQHRPPVALIDHHQVRTVFRQRELVDLTIVDRGASSTCELVYEYARATGAAITPGIATALLTGIVTDTGGFSNPATTLTSLEAAAELMKRGANLRKIVNATVRSKNVGTLQLWGRALSRLEYDPSTGLVTTALLLKDFAECRVERDGSEGIASFLNSLGEGRAVLVLREEPKGLVKGSFRTKQPDVDVAALAQSFGGGGHAKAAGFTVAGTIVRSERGWSVETKP